MDESEIIKEIISSSYLIEVDACILISQGLNQVYRVENCSHNYIFKIYLDQSVSLKDIEGEAELLTLLNQGGAKVCYPFLNQYNKTVTALHTHQGMVYGMLCYFADGEVCYYFNEQQLLTVGRELASIHSITEGLELKTNSRLIDLPSLLNTSLLSLESHFEKRMDDFRYLCGAAGLVISGYTNINLQSCRFGYCHNDFLPHNFHFGADGNIRIFDFELYSKGFLIHDLTSFYIHGYLQMMFGRISHPQLKESYKTFLKGYQMIRPVADEELSLIPYIGFASWIFHMKTDLTRSNEPLYPDYIKDQLTFIRKWMELYIEDNEEGPGLHLL